MTSAVSGFSAALYRDDPLEASVTFTDLALVDSGDHLTLRPRKAAATGMRMRRWS